MTLHQANRGFHRLVVLFVERWGTVREPTYAAQLALAEAYVNLRLLGRAFSRVEALVDHAQATPAAWALGVQILRMRSWFDGAATFAHRARRAFPEEQSLHRLTETAAEPWPSPVLPSDADPATTAIHEAEEAMVQGQFVRAQVELQRVRRNLPQRHGRVDELLWAIRGDFTMDAGIDQLVPLLLPSPESADTLVPADESGLGGPASADAFRKLFQNLDVEDAPDDPELEEPTRITEMAALAKAVRTGQPLESDTHIMRVVARGRSPAPDPDTLETELAGPIPALGDGASSDYARPDHLEDDSIVVMTRRESGREPPETQPFAAEVARVTLDARREALAHRQSAMTSHEAFLRPLPPPPEPAWTDVVRTRLREEGGRFAFWAGGAAVLVFVGFVALVLLLVGRVS